MGINIYKYPLAFVDSQKIWLPRGYTIRAILNQHETPVLYAEVNPTSTHKDQIEVVMKGTGDGLQDLRGHQYIGTVSFSGGAFIWHFYYKGQ